MINEKALTEFITPYYASKDIMHNLWHIDLVRKAADEIVALGSYAIDQEVLTLAACFHGFIYLDEDNIRQWLVGQGYESEIVEKIIQVSWESQRREIPATLEGKILHDAHVLEGGKTYLVVKTLISGSVRGQSLAETLEYMEKHCLGANTCYLPETIPLCAEMNTFALDFYTELIKGIQ